MSVAWGEGFRGRTHAQKFQSLIPQTTWSPVQLDSTPCPAQFLKTVGVRCLCLRGSPQGGVQKIEFARSLMSDRGTIRKMSVFNNVACCAYCWQTLQSRTKNALKLNDPRVIWLKNSHIYQPRITAYFALQTSKLRQTGLTNVSLTEAGDHGLRL